MRVILSKMFMKNSLADASTPRCGLGYSNELLRKFSIGTVLGRNAAERLDRQQIYGGNLVEGPKTALWIDVDIIYPIS